jgi:hypothetical protein
MKRQESIANEEQTTRYSVEELGNLPPHKRPEYAKIIIQNVLEKNKQGMTPQDMAESTGLDERTVRKHLEFLSAVREAYKKDYSPRLTVYFPNGRLMHPIREVTTPIGDSHYSFKEVENTFGEFIYIQEKKRDPITSSMKLLGGIMIPKEAAGQFVSFLEKFIDECSIDGLRVAMEDDKT